VVNQTELFNSCKMIKHISAAIYVTIPQRGYPNFLIDCANTGVEDKWEEGRIRAL